MSTDTCPPAWGCSSLPAPCPPAALVGRGQQLIPSHRLWDRAVEPPEEPTSGSLEILPVLGSALSVEMIPPSFPSQSKQEARLLWEMVLYSRLCPLCFPAALSKQVCRPESLRPLRGGAPHGLAPVQVQQLPPRSILRTTGEPAKGGGEGGGQCPPPYVSFCK